MNFHALEVVSVERTAQDAVCLSLAVPPELRERFRHHAGQYVTLRRAVGGSEQLRTYSIVTPPGGSILRLGIRERPDGRLSRELAQRVRPGERLEVSTPLGRFRTAVDPGRARRYAAFASGSGITPVLSLASDILAREPGSRFMLVYGNRSSAHTMFLEETLALKNRHLARFSVHFVMSREPLEIELLNGRIDAAKVMALARAIPGLASADEYFVCGPGTMVDEVGAALARLNPGAPVRFERFAASTASAAPGAPAGERSAGGAPDAAPREVLATIAVTMDGRRRSFPMAPGDDSVLEAAERAGIALPFSCRSGICATCRTRIVSGAARMTHNVALEPWEIEAGFVLCCQARPTTPSLELSYDEK